MNDVLINQTDIAALFKVPRSSLAGAIHSLPGFPPRVKKTKQGNFYSRCAIKAWAAGKNPAALIRKTNADQRSQSRGPGCWQPSALNNALIKRFISGQFLPAEQREQIAFKKLVARTTQPKTTLITLVPDWARRSRSES